jgi:hypothetical protein
MLDPPPKSETESAASPTSVVRGVDQLERDSADRVEVDVVSRFHPLEQVRYPPAVASEDLREHALLLG